MNIHFSYGSAVLFPQFFFSIQTKNNDNSTVDSKNIAGINAADKGDSLMFKMQRIRQKSLMKSRF